MGAPEPCVLLAISAAAAADAIYVNGMVMTVDPTKPYAEAFAVTNGRFAAIGTNAEIRALATPATTIVDLHGMTVTPGFNDVHLHPVGVYDDSSPYYTPWLGPDQVHNMDDLIAALKRKAQRTPPGQLGDGLEQPSGHEARRAIRIATTWTRFRPSIPS